MNDRKQRFARRNVLKTYKLLNTVCKHLYKQNTHNQELYTCEYDVANYMP